MAGISRSALATRTVTLAIFVLAAGYLVPGCGGVNLATLPPDDIGDTFEYAYMLYVEEIILPDVVYEDENVYFQLRVSAEANQSALGHLSFDSWSRATPTYRLYGNPQERWMIDAFVSADDNPQDEPIDVLPVSLPSMPAGEWVCVVRAAADRSLGGKRCMYKRGDSSIGPVLPREELQELRFTVNVIPRPEE